MGQRVVFFLHQGGYRAASQLGTMAVTAAAMGDEVHVVLAFDALSRWVGGRLGEADSLEEARERARADGLGARPPASLLEEARALGARLWACETNLAICGLTPEAVHSWVDEVAGMASIWRLTAGATVVSL
jgi:peroxiredoxin family protein